MPRDRRWDHLYDREKQPVKSYLLERFAEELRGELAAWPPPFADAVPDELLARHAAGLGTTLGEAALRFGLHVARLELRREFGEIDRLMREEAARHWRAADEVAAGHLLVRYVTERCLALKEQATGVHLAREELAGALELVERRLLLASER
jgi:hypothetical protein